MRNKSLPACTLFNHCLTAAVLLPVTLFCLHGAALAALPSNIEKADFEKSSSSPGSSLKQSQDLFEYYRLGEKVEPQPPAEQGTVTDKTPQQPEAPATDEVKVFISHIVVDASEILTAEEIAAITDPYENRQVSIRELQEVAGKLNALYADKKYITAKAGAIGAKGKRLVVVIPGDVKARAAKDINLEVRSGDLNASSLVSEQGGIDLLVTDGAANITKATAPGGTVILGASKGITMDELEVESLNLNSSGIGGTLTLGTISLGKSMLLAADTINVGSIVHTGNTTPLRLELTGGSKGMADEITIAALSSEPGVVFTRFAADRATVNARGTNNVSFLDARIGTRADIYNRYHYVVADNQVKRLIPSDLQLRPEDRPFFLVMAADRHLLTNALVINYSPDFIVNGSSNDNSLIRQAGKLTVLSSNSSADHTEQLSPGINRFIAGFGGTPNLSFEELTTIIGDPVNLHRGQDNQEERKE